jgi:Fungal Zn(2)-Cys(6) binuclear cluster domain
VRRVRARKPKVKTGCKTCKIRRVKCDEDKPTCYRCRKFGIACDGYGDPLPSSKESKSTLLLPRTAPGLSFYTPSSRVKFDSQEEYQYFLHFCDQVTLDLSGSMPETMWSKVIPRAINSEPALRNLTIAVSAIHKARQSSSAVSHSQFAVRTLSPYTNIWGSRELILDMSRRQSMARLFEEYRS